jgi:hypothetical protein
MTAQHAPHTPPLWRKFLSLPQTGIGWWAVGLASPALVLMAFTNVLALLNTDNPQLSILGVSGSWGEGVLVPLVLITWLLSALFGGIVGFIAVKSDRSLLLLVAQVPGLIIFSFIVWAAISILGGESRGEADVRVTFPIAVLLWAIANFALMWSTRNSGES